MAKRYYIAAPGHMVPRPGGQAVGDGAVRNLSQDAAEPYGVEELSPAGRRMLKLSMRRPPEVIEVPAPTKPVAKLKNEKVTDG